MSHVTMLGCTLRVHPAAPEVGGLPKVILSLAMEQPDDNRYAEVMLDEADRRWLAKELMLGLKPVWYLARCAVCYGGPVPFGDETERDRWATEHASGLANMLQHHPVDIYEEEKR